ncbi:endonuclease/exonuclease/phosphatase family protein [Nitratireductor alexandrii]|uniref:endonuclease/exonuclease/phosphatase family protein n=1 Tax=Nitratireductor alexandrii TaxID=2448161 RepID=UPI000FD8F34E|nr:endonuclease/exonuclease/phosphatase family protein [Nitratireductor alexandrii]
MKCVTYNIQYGIGLDGRYDLARIADAVRGADLIALQEVSRNNPDNAGRDMVAELGELLPDYFSVFGAPYQADMGSAVESGRAVTRMFEFGNMVLSKKPILSSRNLLLPRQRTFDRLNLQRGALEAMVETPFGPVRFYSVHLDHTSPAERIDQIGYLVDKALAYGIEGGALTGTSERGFPEPPHPEAFALMGDFNLVPGSPEYIAMTGHPDVEFGVTRRSRLPVDAAVLADPDHAARVTWLDPKRIDDANAQRCLDYCFVYAGLAARVKRCWVDTQALGSDHRPVWMELG